MRDPAHNPFRQSEQYTCYGAAWVARQLGGTGEPNSSGFYAAYCPCCHGPQAKLWLKNRAGRLFVGCHYGCQADDIYRQIDQLVRSGDYAALPPPAEQANRVRPEESSEARMRQAAEFWHASIPDQTRLKDYFAHRGIDLDKIPVPLRWEDLRLHPSLRHPSGQYSPAMIALVRDVDGAPAAIHRTWLATDYRSKAAVDPPRLTLAPVSTCAVRLAEAGSEILLAEGIETTLAAMLLAGLPGWSCLSASGLAGVRLPPTIRTVVIAADHDETGLRAAWQLCRRLEGERREVRLIRPEQPGTDFNTLLQRIPDHA